jgi:hypothetical protein
MDFRAENVHCIQMAKITSNVSSVVSHGCIARCLTLNEENKLWMFEDVQRNVERKTKEITGD